MANPDILPYVLGDTKEGPVFTVTDENTGLALDISGCNPVEFRVFTQDKATLLCIGTLVNTKINLSYGATNQGQFEPGPGDFNIVGTFRGELYLKFSDGREKRDQNVIIKISDDAPAS